MIPTILYAVACVLYCALPVSLVGDHSCSHLQSIQLPEYLQKGSTSLGKSHIKLKIQFKEVFEADGNFSFKLIVVSPRGQYYSSDVFHSTHLPTHTPTILRIDNAEYGNYIVYSKIVNVIAEGHAEFLLTVSNTKSNKNMQSLRSLTRLLHLLAKHVLTQALE